MSEFANQEPDGGVGRSLSDRSWPLVKQIGFLAVDRFIDFLERWVVGIAVNVGRHIGERVLVNASRVPNARFSGFTLVIPFLALVAIPLGVAQSIALNIWVLDYSLPLDTSLRWLHGHIPHIDFQTPIGAAYWVNQGLATVLMGGVDARTPIVANFIAVLPIIISAIALLRCRLSGGLFGLMVLASMLLVISPRSPGDIPGQISFLAAYNKAGLSILAVLLVAMFIEPLRARSDLRQTLDAVVFGLLLFWLVYLKVTFAAVAVLAAIAALHYAPRNRRVILLGTAFAVVGIALTGWLAGINAAYFGDVSDAAAAGDAIRYGKLLRDLVDSRLTIVVYLISVILYWRLSAATPKVKQSNLVISLGIFLVGLLAMNQVHDNYLALCFVALLVLAQKGIVEAADGRNHVRWKSFMPPLIGAVTLIMAAMLADAISSVYYYSSTRNAGVGAHPSSLCEQPKTPICRIVYQVFDPSDGDWVRPLPNPEFAPRGQLEETAGGDDGLLSVGAMLDQCDAREDCLFWKIQEQLYLLLNQHIRADDRPFFLGFMNVLPYTYQIEPPKHVPSWLDVGRNISQESHPDPELLFSDVTLLAVPKVYFDVGRIPGLNEIYEDDIPSFFDLVVETDSWEIWRKR